MIIYRPHRGGLRESLELAKEFETEEDMKDFIFNYHKEYFFSLGYEQPPFDIEDVVIDKENKTNDERCGWHDTMYVCVKRYGNEEYVKKYGCPQCIGMCATDYER